MNKRKKRAVTLIEIMIVILLIGVIGGALAFNMRGSMDRGRVFKTRQHIARVQDALMMQVANGQIDNLEETVQNRAKLLEALTKSGMIKEPDKILKDGWGKDLVLVVQNDEINASSPKLDEWERANEK